MRELGFANVIENILSASYGDVLYIIDSCYAASAGVENRREVLAASSIEQAADGGVQGLQTLTKALCEILGSHPEPATIAQIHARLIHHWQNADSNMHPQVTPVHRAAEEPKTASVVLAPLATYGVRPTVRPEKSVGYSKVLITVALDVRTPLSLEQWREWLTANVSPEAGSIEVVGLFETTSRLVLLTLPVALWDTLVDNPAYCFVGFVTSTNLIMQELESAASGSGSSSRALAIRARDLTGRT